MSILATYRWGLPRDGSANRRRRRKSSRGMARRRKKHDLGDPQSRSAIQLFKRGAVSFGPISKHCLAYGLESNNAETRAKMVRQ